MASSLLSKPNGNALVDETTPLIAASAAGPTVAANEDRIAAAAASELPADRDEEDKPLPKFQIFLLCLARTVDPIAFFAIFPFVNEMIGEVGSIPEANIGFHSGLIESLFSLTQMLVMIGWGRLSDSIGRKPVLIISLVGSSLSMALFGLSKQIWQMIFFRCCAGLFAGTVVTIRTMLSELTTAKTQAKAFSYFAFAGNLGIFIGPLFGGCLAKPAVLMPSVFGGIRFFEENPYALPNFCTAAISVVAAVSCALFLEETLETKSGSEASAGGRMSIPELVQSPGVAMVLLIYVMSVLTGIAYTAVLPLFWFTSTELGGWGLTSFQISIFLGINGIAQAAWLLFAFPPLQNRFGTKWVLLLCAWAWPAFLVCYPTGNALLRHHVDTIFWIIAPILLVLGSGVAMNYTAVQLALNDIAPSRETLGTLNALVLSIISGIRAVVPALFTSLFAMGARTQWLNGYFIWAIFLVIVSFNIFLTYRLPKKAEGKLHRDVVDEERTSRENGRVSN